MWNALWLNFNLKQANNFAPLISYIRKIPFQKQSFRGVLSKRCSENMQQIYRRNLPIPSAISFGLLKFRVLDLNLIMDSIYKFFPLILFYALNIGGKKNTSTDSVLAKMDFIIFHTAESSWLISTPSLKSRCF